MIALLKILTEEKLNMIKLVEILQDSDREDVYPFSEIDLQWGEYDNLIYVTYYFRTPKYVYNVSFDSSDYDPDEKTFELSFGVKTLTTSFDAKIMTGEGEAKKILKTIKEIIEDFLTDYKDSGAEYLEVYPTDEKRRRVYKLLFPQLPKNIASKIKVNESIYRFDRIRCIGYKSI